MFLPSNRKRMEQQESKAFPEISYKGAKLCFWRSTNVEHRAKNCAETGGVDHLGDERPHR